MADSHTPVFRAPILCQIMLRSIGARRWDVFSEGFHLREEGSLREITSCHRNVSIPQAGIATIVHLGTRWVNTFCLWDCARSVSPLGRRGRRPLFRGGRFGYHDKGFPVVFMGDPKGRRYSQITARIFSYPLLASYGTLKVFIDPPQGVMVGRRCLFEEYVAWFLLSKAKWGCVLLQGARLIVVRFRAPFRHPYQQSCASSLLWMRCIRSGWLIMSGRFAFW